MNVTQRDRDLGTAYAMKPSTSRTELTEVGRGTPMGELLRRYWHPVGLVGDATDVPRKVRALGEDLILFRDRHGRVGLLHARCCHRGTTLYYGKVEEDGIRCCYHGWKFDTEGHCLEQPCEPDGGQFRDKVRQPWYPVEERYGLIFAYMGPAEKKPVLPRYEALEKMDDGEFVEADDSSIGGGGPAVIPCNWLQHFENVVDPYHVPVLHGSFSGPQFTNMMASMPEVKFEMSPRGVTVRSIRNQDDGKIFYRVTEAALPDAPRGAQSAGRAIRPRRIDRLDAADRRHVLPHLCRRPGQAARRYRADALEIQRQVLVGHDRAGAPAIPRRLRGAGRPGAGDAAFRGAFRPERPRHPDGAADAERAARGDGGRARSDRRIVRAKRAAGRIRGGKFHSRGVSAASRLKKQFRGKPWSISRRKRPRQRRQRRRPSARRYYVLALLTAVYALNFLDRTIFNVLIEPIKKEFTLSDTTMGLLAGFGFVLFYSLLGIPIARVADRLNRRNIVAVAFAFWSAMTFLCGMAQSVATLALARIGVGIGESAGTPASQSMVADLFDKDERPRALGIYAIGTYLGVFLGYFIGGWVNQHYGWRMAFFSAGLPGIALAAVLWLTVSEPNRGAMAETFAPEPLGPTLAFSPRSRPLSSC